MNTRRDYYAVAIVLVLILAISVTSYMRDGKNKIDPTEFEAPLDLSNDQAVEYQIISYLVNRDNDVVKIVNMETVHEGYNVSITLLDISDRNVTTSDNQTKPENIRFFIASFVNYAKPNIETHLTGWIDENRQVHEWDGVTIHWVNGTHGESWTPREYATPSSSTVEGMNNFTFRLYNALRSSENNILFSPYSVSTALSMVYEGARGETAEEMQTVLSLNPDENMRLSEIDELVMGLNETQGCELETANALWLQEDYPLDENYRSKLIEYYHSEARQQDFYGTPEEARIAINAWVEDKTHERIKNLFSNGSITSDTRLVLTNAIYFKGQWRYTFNPSSTRTQPFYTQENDTISVGVDMMYQRHKALNYTEKDDVQILELPYINSSLSMILLLPENQTLEELEDILTEEKLFSWLGYLREQDVKVYLPKFSYESKYTLNPVLSEMGMEKVFTPGEADLTGINPEEKLYVSTVVHQAFIDVNEEGTEAVASTGVVVEGYGANMGAVFRADHPFLYLILDKESGAILFMGRVVNPSR